MFKIEQINDNIRIAGLDLTAFAAEQALTKKRDIEKAGIEFLLNKLLAGKTFNLKYNENNKPFLEGENLHLSISHSHDKLAIILNSKECTGIDVELIREKIKNIANKFLNENEIIFANENVELLTTLWAAKEALYKVYGLKELDFRKNIFIEKFDMAQNNFFGKIELPNFKKRYLLSKAKTENYILVYILNEV